MSTPFLTIAEAVTRTGKSRRTLLRLAHALAQTQSTQVMREKTARGYIWRIHQQALPQAVSSQPPATQPVAHPQEDAQLPHPVAPPDNYLAIVQQGYAGMLAMHQEVKQVYETQLKEKEQRITELTQALAQAKPGFWRRVFGWLGISHFHA